jgi:hypothetical protein
MKFNPLQYKKQNHSKMHWHLKGSDQPIDMDDAGKSLSKMEIFSTKIIGNL